MLAGETIEGLRFWIKTQVRQVTCQNKSDQLTWPVSRTERMRGVRPHTSPQFPSLSQLVLASQFLWPVVSVVDLMLWRGKRKEGSYTLPDWATTRFAGSFGHVICEVIFFLCVQSDLILILYVVSYGAALYLCFSRTVPLYPLRFFLVFVSFLNYA